MRVFLCFLLAICSFECILCGNLPSYLKACSASDPNLNACIEKTIVAAGPKFTYGIPEFGIEPLDPIQLGTIPIDNAGLKLTFKNTVVSGLRGFKLNSFKMNTAKGRVMLDFTANVTLKGDYEMDGQIIILPIKGHGQTKIKITNLNIIIKYEFVTKDGYWTVTDHKDMYKMDRAVFKFTNLFGGNKQLADTTSQFMNQNWSIIMEEIAPPAVKLIIKKCVDEVKKLFANVPAAELMLP